MRKSLFRKTHARVENSCSRPNPARQETYRLLVRRNLWSQGKPAPIAQPWGRETRWTQRCQQMAVNGSHLKHTNHRGQVRKLPISHHRSRHNSLIPVVLFNSLQQQLKLVDATDVVCITSSDRTPAWCPWLAHSSRQRPRNAPPSQLPCRAGLGRYQSQPVLEAERNHTPNDTTIYKF